MYSQTTPELFQTFLEYTPTAIAMFDRQMCYIAASRRWFTDYNLNYQSLIGRSHYEVFPENTNKWKEIHQRCLAGFVESCEADSFIHPDGSISWVNWESRPWYQSDGEIGGIICFSEVRQELKEYKHHLSAFAQHQHNEERFQKLLGNLLAVVYQYVLCPDGSYYFPYVSPGCREICELEPEEIQQDPNSIFKLIHEEDLGKFQELIAHSVQSLEPWHCEWRFVTSSGAVKWVQGLSRPEKQKNGNIIWDGLVIDITQRKQAEEELQKLACLIENSSDFIGIATLDGKSLFLNEAGRQLVGIASEKKVEQLKISDFHIPEDWVYLQTEILPLVMEQGRWQGEFRFRHFQSGAAIAIEYNIFTIKDHKTGQAIGLGTITRDITQRKQVEAERQHFVSLVENSSDFIAVASLDVKTLYINKAGQNLVGIESKEEYLETYISDYHTPEDWKHFQENIAPIVIKQGRWQGESCFRHFKTNKLIPIEYNVFTLNDKNTGQPTAFATVTRDITERKQAEAALRQSEKRYRELADREQLLNRLASQIRKSLNLEQVLQTAIEEIRNLLQIDRCSFSWFNPNVNPPSWKTITEAKNSDLPSLLGHHSTDKIGSVTGLFIKQEILQIDDVTKFTEITHKEFLESLGIKSEIVLPLKTLSGRIGVIVCGHWTEIRPWSYDEVELLQAVVDQLAIAINQAELYTQSQQAALTAEQHAQQLEQTLEKLQKTQSQLIQSEKMSSLGQLVAGVAHEINNPVNFIYGNLNHAYTYTEDVLNLIKLYQQSYPEATPEIKKQINTIELDFVVTDLPKIISSMKVGAERIRGIVQSLRTFSRLDEAQMKKVDIHEGIESTLLILQHRLKGTKDNHTPIELIKQYGNLPPVVCYAGELNQVFMNLLTNAIDVLEEAARKDKLFTPMIQIITEVLANSQITIRIIDNGVGMTPEVQKRLFDPFFTTKPVGTGTGLGLSISYQIIIEKHHGNLHCFSELGKGTEFVIEIPVSQPGNT